VSLSVAGERRPRRIAVTVATVAVVALFAQSFMVALGCE
jgi:hypothetical protein